MLKSYACVSGFRI